MIFKFNPIFKSTIWGGERISKLKGISTTTPNIGESWEISGVKGNVSVVSEGCDAGKTMADLIITYKDKLLGKRNYERFGNEFPLLVKIIDAQQDLSIQVHPDDILAMQRHNSKGKTEMWYVIDTTQNAHIRSGLKTLLTPEQYVSAVEDNSICEKLADYKAKPGDVFFLPAGRIHSIGAGCLIAEIQQTSDITYRIYDFDRKDKHGNKRELHTELAKDAIDYTLSDDYRMQYNSPDNGLESLVTCSYFNVKLCVLDNTEISVQVKDSFVIILTLDGILNVSDGGEDVSVKQGETILISADSAKINLTSNHQICKALIAYID